MAQTRPASTPANEHEWDPYGPTLIVLVGRPLIQEFHISLNMICHYSGFFRNAVSWPHNLPFTPEDSIVRLPCDSPDTFSRIISYCQHRTFATSWNSETPLLHHLSYDDLIDLYSTALTLDMPLIQNTTTDLFAQKLKESHTFLDRWSIESLWLQTPPGSPLRALLIDLVRAMFINDERHYHSSIWNSLVGGNSTTPERLISMIQELETAGYGIRVSARSMRRVEACYFHFHDDGEGCDDPDERFMGVGGRAEAEIVREQNLRRRRRG